MRPAFMWQTQIQTTEYGFNDNDTIRKKRKKSYLYFTRFQTVFQSRFGKIFVTKKAGPLEPFLS